MGSPAGLVLGRTIGAAVLFCCAVVASSAPQVAAYGKKVGFGKDHAIRFPDFELTFLERRHVSSPVFPRGFVFYDFQAVSGDETVGVRWSEGTGDIAPAQIRIAGSAFMLELRFSEAEGWLADGELVVTRAAGEEPALSIQVLGDLASATFYRYEDLLAVLAHRAGPVLLRVTERDIERCLVEPSPSAVMALELSEAASARWREAVTDGPHDHPFHVDLRGRRLFSGLTYAAYGAAAIEYPILDPIDRGPRIVLFVRSGLVEARTPELREAQRRRIEDPELRQVFKARGALEERPRVDYPWPRFR